MMESEVLKEAKGYEDSAACYSQTVDSSSSVLELDSATDGDSQRIDREEGQSLSLDENQIATRIDVGAPAANPPKGLSTSDPAVQDDVKDAIARLEALNQAECDATDLQVESTEAIEARMLQAFDTLAAKSLESTVELSIDTEPSIAAAFSNDQTATAVVPDAEIANAIDSSIVDDASSSTRVLPETTEASEAIINPASDMGNIALDADELETLQDLVTRYDQVVQDLDILNKQIESLLAAEGIKGCES